MVSESRWQRLQVPMVPLLSLTSRYLLHKDLDEAILTDGAQVLHNVLVFQMLVEGDLLVEGLGVPV